MNVLLAAMRDDDARALLARSEQAELKVHDTLEAPNVPITHVNFPESGVVSVVVTAPETADRSKLASLVAKA